MMKTVFRAILLCGSVAFSGCAAIHFENGPVVPDPEDKGFSFTFGLFEEDVNYDAGSAVRKRLWYHQSILQIAELSNPLETNQVCAGLEWNQITTEVTPFDAIVGLVDNALLLHASSAGLDLWSPWSIEYSCRDER